jgi:hypothetical protein
LVENADAAPTRSTTIALTSDEMRVVVVNREANSLSIIRVKDANGNDVSKAVKPRLRAAARVGGRRAPSSSQQLGDGSGAIIRDSSDDLGEVMSEAVELCTSRLASRELRRGGRQHRSRGIIFLRM